MNVITSYNTVGGGPSVSRIARNREGLGLDNCVFSADDADWGAYDLKARTGLPTSCGVRAIIFATRDLATPAPPDAVELGLTPSPLADPLWADENLMVLLVQGHDAAEIRAENIAFFGLFSVAQQNWDEHGGEVFITPDPLSPDPAQILGSWDLGILGY